MNDFKIEINFAGDDITISVFNNIIKETTTFTSTEIDNAIVLRCLAELATEVKRSFILSGTT